MFSINDLHFLIADLDINPDLFSPFITKSETVVELISYLERAQRIDDLITLLQRVRPYAPWTSIYFESQKERKIDTVTLRDTLVNHFNMNELKSLCFDLGINFDSLPGETMQNKSQELIVYLQRHDRIEELVNQIRRLRPNIILQETDPVGFAVKERGRLRNILTNKFNEEDLKNLSFDLGIDYEDLPAYGRQGKAREIVNFFERRGRLKELQEAIERLRPGINIAD
jgi:hypothetical protein